MPEGTCVKCGRKYEGWALNQPEQLICACGGKILVRAANRKRISVPGYARFTKNQNRG